MFSPLVSFRASDFGFSGPYAHGVNYNHGGGAYLNYGAGGGAASGDVGFYAPGIKKSNQQR